MKLREEILMKLEPFGNARNSCKLSPEVSLLYFGGIKMVPWSTSFTWLHGHGV